MKLFSVVILALINIKKIKTEQQVYLKESCKVWRVIKRYEDGSEDDKQCYCELQGKDLDHRKYKMLPLVDMPSQICKDTIASGKTEILSHQLMIDNTTINSQLKLITENTIERESSKNRWNDMANQIHMNHIHFTEINNGRRRLTTKGTRSVIVIRGIGADSESTKTKSQLADDIFGTEGDVLNFKSQFEACSYGALTFEPATEIEGITNGVYDVEISQNIEGADEEDLENEFLDQATTDLGVSSLSLLANHVILCIPPGTVSKTRRRFVAYAYLDGYVSVFNDKLCSSPTVVMHEVAHNLGLSHSNERDGGKTINYGDQSGLMGFAYASDDSPNLCFNGVKTYQLGWFSEYHHDISYPNIRWDGTLVGFVDKNDAAGRPMILRLINKNNLKDRVLKDYYIHFNRKDGFNSGTQEGGDKVLVASRTSGTSAYSDSLREAELGRGERYTISMNDEENSNVVILVESIRSDNNGILEAHVVISSPISSTTDAPTPSPTRRTLAPSSTNGCNDDNNNSRRTFGNLRSRFRTRGDGNGCTETTSNLASKDATWGRGSKAEGEASLFGGTMPPLRFNGGNGGFGDVTRSSGFRK